jgi:peptidoglycan/LPS O-acetylase OafA/YrhL
MSVPAGVRASTRYFPELEGLRGIAIILVFASHAAGFVRARHAADFAWPWRVFLGFIEAGHTGVTLFFVLSAFLLGGPFVGDAPGGRAPQRREYLRRRALRILPLYYAGVIVAVLLTLHDISDLLRAPAYMLFLNSAADVVAPLFPYSAVWWSLATEVQFYLILPLLPGLLRRRLLLAIVVAIYAAVYLAFLSSSLGLSTLEGRFALASSLFGRAPVFAAGLAITWLYQSRGAWLIERVESSRALGLAMLAVILALAMILGELLSWVGTIGFFEAEVRVPYWHAAEGVLWAGIVFLVVIGPRWLRQAIGARALAWIGICSYSIYMLHFPILYFGLGYFGVRGDGWTLRNVIVSAGLAGLSCLAATLTYKIIERPFLVRKARLDV